MNLIDQIKENARKYNRRIVLAEGEEDRTLKAADRIIGEKIAQIVLLGNPEVINGKAAEFGLKNIGNATIIDPKNNPKQQFYAEMLCEIRKSKGMQMDEAMKLVVYNIKREKIFNLLPFFSFAHNMVQIRDNALDIYT